MRSTRAATAPGRRSIRSGNRADSYRRAMGLTPLRVAIVERDLDVPRQLEVLLRHSARIVRRACKRDPRVVDRNVRMMVGGFGNLGDLLHELDAVQEFLELERLADGVVLVLPSGKRLQLVRDLLRTELGHVEYLQCRRSRLPLSILVLRLRIANDAALYPLRAPVVKHGASRPKRTQGTLKRRWRTNTLPTKPASKSARSPNRGRTRLSAARSAASPRRSKIAIRSSTM